MFLWPLFEWLWEWERSFKHEVWSLFCEPLFHSHSPTMCYCIYITACLPVFSWRWSPGQSLWRVVMTSWCHELVTSRQAAAFPRCAFMAGFGGWRSGAFEGSKIQRVNSEPAAIGQIQNDKNGWQASESAVHANSQMNTHNYVLTSRCWLLAL